MNPTVGQELPTPPTTISRTGWASLAQSNSVAHLPGIGIHLYGKRASAIPIHSKRIASILAHLVGGVPRRDVFPRLADVLAVPESQGTGGGDGDQQLLHSFLPVIAVAFVIGDPQGGTASP